MNEAISPKGQPYRDLDNIFTLWRGDVDTALAHCRTPLEAFRLLEQLRFRSTKESPYMHPSAPKDETADAFFKSRPNTFGYWHDMYTLLKKTGRFTDKFELMNATSMFLAQSPFGGKQLDLQEREDCGSVALSALDKAYNEEK